MRIIQRAVLAEALAEITDYLMPVSCCVCGVAAYSLCAGCCAQIPSETQVNSFENLTVFSGATLSPELGQIMAAFKDSHRTAMTKYLAPLLARANEAALGGASGQEVIYVPVPQSLRARRSRGFSPVRMLAAAIDLPLTPMLSWARKVRDQRGLSIEERAENLAGALEFRGKYRNYAHRRGRHIVLVDDVLTTGATLLNAAAPFSRAGASSISAISVAITPKRWQKS